MVGQWKGYQLQRASCIVFFIILNINGCLSLNYEGRALLAFRKNVLDDPYDAFANWNAGDSNPCMWSGVRCMDGHVSTLNLRRLSLVGKLAPELGKLSHLRILALCKNHFFGEIPKEVTRLTNLEILDLRGNNLNGTIPPELDNLLSLKYLLLGDNDFEVGVPSNYFKHTLLLDSYHDRILLCDLVTGVGCINRKFGTCIWQSSLKKANSFYIPLKRKLLTIFSKLPRFQVRTQSSISDGGKSYDTFPGPDLVHDGWYTEHIARRELLAGGSSSNLAALPAPDAPAEPVTAIPTMGSGSFAATSNSSIPDEKNNSPQPAGAPPSESVTPWSPTASHTPASAIPNAESKRSDDWKYMYVVPAGVFCVCVASAFLCMCRNKGVATIGPWKTGLSGQLQKAFVTGVPKLNRAELETACEDFSNIITTYPYCTIYKGTLSSGVEIAVATSSVKSAKDWPKDAEHHFRKKIDTLSRVNHKNFVNLLGYYEEDETFLRLMVFEYAPSGSLFEHLHVKEVEHLDWPARMRVLMGIAYCLQYMHHELNPPVVHPELQSKAVLLTDDNAAKVTEIGFWKDFVTKGKIASDDDADISELRHEGTESNVYTFGLLMLEIISGKLPYSEEQGPLVDWVAEYLNGKHSLSYMIDPTLKTFKNSELEVICEVIQECVNEDPRQRPTMKEVTTKLREVIAISPEAATPRLSPLWWAELEILSVEAS